MTMDNQPWIYVAHCAAATLGPENNPDSGESIRQPVRERMNAAGVVVLGSRRPLAIGYLRKDVSGVAQSWHESQIRSLTKRYEYNLAKTVALGASAEDPVAKLIEAAYRVRASAVIVPSTAHFEAERVPDELTRLVDVITVTPEFTYARWTLNPERWSKSGRDPA